MHVLLLRLEGPMQSWGTQSRFDHRDTGLEPSKSGVIGLLCAALGRPRTAPVDDLIGLRQGVRVDREGTVQLDYQTAGGARDTGESAYGVATFDGTARRTVQTWRNYLAGANFLVGLEASTPAHEDLLRALDAALARPVWQLYLGRKAFVPATPIRLPETPPLGPGLRAGTLEQALREYPWPPNTAGPLRFVVETNDTSTGESRMDVPVSFAPLDRRYQLRFVRTERHERGSVPAIGELEE